MHSLLQVLNFEKTPQHSSVTQSLSASDFRLLAAVFVYSEALSRLPSLSTASSQRPHTHHLCLCQHSICRPHLCSQHNYAGGLCCTDVLYLYVAFINEWVDIRLPGRSKGSCLSNLGERAQVHRGDACSRLTGASARSNFCIKIFHFYRPACRVKIN